MKRGLTVGFASCLLVAALNAHAHQHPARPIREDYAQMDADKIQG